MDAKNINLILRQAIQENHLGALELSPWQIARFLEIFSKSLHDHVCNANEQLGADSEAYIPPIELEKIDSFFRELIDNFFPMAHSYEPLRNLQIVERDKFLRVQQHLMELRHVREHAREASDRLSDASDRLSDSIQRLFNP
jgi:hypothetical protein